MALVEKAFGDIITFTRASGGGRINALGQYEWVSDGVARLTYDPVTLQPLGLLIEEQRTNLLTRSSNVADVAWNKVACTASPAGISPEGLPAEKITPAAGAGNHYYGQAAGFAGAVDNGVFSLSLRIKADGYNHFHIQGKTKSDLYPAANVDLAAGTITLINASGSATASIEPLSGGWYLCSLSWSVLTGAHPLSLFLTPKPTAMNSVSFTADGVSGALVSGHQLEPASVKSSHIPTAASQVTRAADVCSVNTLAPWYNPLEGTLVVKGELASAAVVNRYLASISTPGTLNNRADIFLNAPGAAQFRVVSSGAIQLAAQVDNPSARAFALTWGGGKPGQGAAGGIPSSSALIASSPTVTQLRIGCGPLANEFANGIIQSITYYPRVIDVQQASA